MNAASEGARPTPEQIEKLVRRLLQTHERCDPKGCVYAEAALILRRLSALLEAAAP